MDHDIPFDARVVGDKVFLVRPSITGEDERILDAQFPRLRAGELVWRMTEKTPDYPHPCDWTPGDFARAVLIGKGPSLDDWLVSEPGPDDDCLWVALNEAALVVQESDYVVCLDSPCLRKRLSGRIPETCRLITRLDRVQDAGEPRLRPLCFTFGDRLGVGADGSAGAALRVLSAWGIQDVLMVGFDGWDDPDRNDYAHAVQNADVPPRDGGEDWSDCNASIRRAIEETGLRVVWWHRLERGDDAGSGPQNKAVLPKPIPTSTAPATGDAVLPMPLFPEIPAAGGDAGLGAAPTAPRADLGEGEPVSGE